MPMQPLIVVIGPTAAGKSWLGLELALRLGGEIVSADSRQVYRCMDIGTAKPTMVQRALVPHHLVDVVDPDQPYSVVTYREQAHAAIEEVRTRGRRPLLVGGTGLYVRAVTENLVIPRVPPDPALRAGLEERAWTEGLEALHQELARLDPVAASRIDRQNPRRLIRALEVCLSTGRPFSQQQGRESSVYRLLRLGLTCSRPELYRRIDARVDRMMADGWLDEVQRLVQMGYGFHLPAMSGLGYRQLGMYLRGELSLAEAVQRIKFDTHRFARQQYNWFRLDDQRIRWLEPTEQTRQQVLETATELVNGFMAN